uniref:Uncharacterized protein n=1 Tax=Kwoniella dejecticola CBS 10117 TaxID=1296121 RepID=A0A1A6A516_9TREE|nr:uncharacterized protein I303_04489 [Kwoniella dejecticola CBS 10117]OBR85157.1 hypothetical protein I303_04489 [Kwoniella dejecticola CBS 10117]
MPVGPDKEAAKSRELEAVRVQSPTAAWRGRGSWGGGAGIPHSATPSAWNHSKAQKSRTKIITQTEGNTFFPPSTKPDAFVAGPVWKSETVRLLCRNNGCAPGDSLRQGWYALMCNLSRK